LYRFCTGSVCQAGKQEEAMINPITDLLAFGTYTITMCVTPGPNNAMLATLGARHGFRATAPAVAGVAAGVFGMLLVACTGIGAAVEAAPGLRTALTIGGAAYMGYLARTLWSAGPVDDGDRPVVGFLGAAALQVVNPKVLLMALTTAGTFLAPRSGFIGAAVLAAAFATIGLPCVALWALAGDRLRTFLGHPLRAKLFSRTMAVLVACTAVAVLAERPAAYNSGERAAVVTGGCPTLRDYTAAGTGTAWMASTSISNLTLSPTSSPPVSRATFHTRPKSLRSIAPVIVKPLRVSPHGDFCMPA